MVVLFLGNKSNIDSNYNNNNNSLNNNNDKLLWTSQI